MARLASQAQDQGQAAMTEVNQWACSNCSTICSEATSPSRSNVMTDHASVPSMPGHCPHRGSRGDQAIIAGRGRELAFARAYVAGEIDIEGDIYAVISLRDASRPKVTVSMLRTQRSRRSA
jgi:hypothetical protein